VIAATNRDLRREFQSGAFRQDLYFRLAVFDIGLPPLCRREDDIGPLAQRFLQRLAASGQPVGPLTDRALAELKRRRWLGNVRELRNAVEHGALLARGGAIEPEHLPAPLDLDSASPTAPINPAAALRQAVRDWAAAELNDAASAGAASAGAASPGVAGQAGAGQGAAPTDLYQRFLSAAEPPLFDAVLDATSQNRAAAAERLGIHRATLRKKLQ
jgi:two-component system nitrogen regulation response regulator GlnG